MKMARTLNQKQFVYSYSPLKVAEAMAFGNACIGCIHYCTGFIEIDEEREKYIKFYVNHPEFFEENKTISKIAVLRNYHSLAYECHFTHLSTILAEQTLFEKSIPFDIIFDEQLEDEKIMGKYTILILANQKYIPQSIKKQIESFVEKGGNLLTIECPLNEKIESKNNSFTKYGKGKIIHISKIVPSTPEKLPHTPYYGMEYSIIDTRYWKLPQNADEIVEAIRFLDSEAIPLTISAPRGVIAELQKGKKENIIIHLLNFNSSAQTGNIFLTITLPEIKNISKIIAYFPEKEKSEESSFEKKNHSISLTINGLSTYIMINLF